jgi:hypothetical protein
LSRRSVRDGVRGAIVGKTLSCTVAVPLRGPVTLGVLKHSSRIRCHHLLKTFWTGWRDEQHPDGTEILLAYIPPNIA